MVTSLTSSIQGCFPKKLLNWKLKPFYKRMNTFYYLPNHQERFSQGSQVIKTFLINYIDTSNVSLWVLLTCIIWMKREKSCAASRWRRVGQVRLVTIVVVWSGLAISSDLQISAISKGCGVQTAAQDVHSCFGNGFSKQNQGKFWINI